jgi:hypothetical protein
MLVESHWDDFYHAECFSAILDLSSFFLLRLLNMAQNLICAASRANSSTGIVRGAPTCRTPRDELQGCDPVRGGPPDAAVTVHFHGLTTLQPMRSKGTASRVTIR